MVLLKRMTDERKIMNLDELRNHISDPEIKQHLESFKQKIDYGRYFIFNYELGRNTYNTPLAIHDITLIFRSNTEAALFILKSSLDCLANFLNKFLALEIPQSKVDFNKILIKVLKEKNQDKIASIIQCFLDKNNYFLKIRNQITHNKIINFKIDLGDGIKAHFLPLDEDNYPSISEVGEFFKDLNNKIYSLSENIFNELQNSYL